MLGSLLKVLTPIDVPNKGMSLKGLYKPLPRIMRRMCFGNRSHPRVNRDYVSRGVEKLQQMEHGHCQNWMLLLHHKQSHECNKSSNGDWRKRRLLLSWTRSKMLLGFRVACFAYKIHVINMWKKSLSLYWIQDTLLLSQAKEKGKDMWLNS